MVIILSVRDIYIQHRTSAMLLGFGAVDLLFGALFILAYVKTPAESHGRG